MIVRLYHIPTDEVDSIKAAYDDGNYAYCIQKCNDFEVFQANLCFCAEGIKAVQDYLPTLWSSTKL